MQLILCNAFDEISSGRYFNESQWLNLKIGHRYTSTYFALQKLDINALILSDIIDLLAVVQCYSP